MSVQAYHLADDFVDVDAERALLASLTSQPRLYWECVDLLHADVFAGEPEAWRSLSGAITSEKTPSVPPEWMATADTIGTARRLADL